MSQQHGRDSRGTQPYVDPFELAKQAKEVIVKLTAIMVEVEPGNEAKRALESARSQVENAYDMLRGRPTNTSPQR